MLKMIKKRKAKISKRGIYIQDVELMETHFTPGSSYKYVVDPKQKQVLILPESKGKNKVSKRAYKDTEKPVIDIRHNECKTIMNGAEYLEVEIYKKKIVVKGFVEEKTEAIRDNVTSIQSFLNAKKIAEVSISRSQLQEVVGGSASRSNSSVGEEIDLVIKAAALFAGAGIQDLGFQEAGFEVVYAVEKDEAAAETYAHNIGTHIMCADINDLLEQDIPQTRLVFGSPPCRGFSNANRRTNVLDNPDNHLVRSYIEWIKGNRACEVFVMENVPQMLSMGSRQFLNEIVKGLSEFEITSGVINAKDYGSPQHRKRAFVIGSKIGRIELPKALVKSYRSVGEAFKGLKEDMPNQQDYSDPKPETLERYKHIPPGGNFKNIPKEICPRVSHSNCYRRLTMTDPAPTIANMRKSQILHPLKDRTLSIREAARLFDVPDWFTFKGGKSEMQQQICNAVPVKLAKAVAEKVMAAFTMNAQLQRG